jgi:hypothetical protein
MRSGSITPPPERRPPSPDASDRQRTGRGVPHAESAPTAERFHGDATVTGRVHTTAVARHAS